MLLFLMPAFTLRMSSRLINAHRYNSINKMKSSTPPLQLGSAPQQWENIKFSINCSTNSVYACKSTSSRLFAPNLLYATCTEMHSTNCFTAVFFVIYKFVCSYAEIIWQFSEHFAQNECSNLHLTKKHALKLSNQYFLRCGSQVARPLHVFCMNIVQFSAVISLR